MVYGLNVQPVYGYTPKADPLDGFDGPFPALNPVNDGGIGWSGETGGVPVDGGHFPKRMRWADPYGNPVPDFDQMPTLNVSRRARDVIERLEPDVHQFFRVTYVNPDGMFLEERFWLIVCNRLDSVNREHTTMVLRDGVVWRPVRDLVRRGEPIPKHLDPGTKSKLVFDMTAIGKHHLWKDKHLDGDVTLISDEAAAAFGEAGLTGLQLAGRRRDTV